MQLSELNNNTDQGVEKMELSYTVDGNVNWCDHCGKKYGSSLKNLKVELPYDAAIPLLGTYPEKTNLSRCIYSNIHSSTIYNSQDVETS